MTMDFSWRDVAALWGAGLSTWLAIVRSLPPRPRFYIEASNQAGADLIIRVVNPSKRTRLVKVLCRLRSLGTEPTLGVYIDPSEAQEPLRVAIKSEAEATITVNCLINRDRAGQKNYWLVIFGWQGSWAVPWLWVPVPVFVSTPRANRLKAAK
jgi:hypothetical protein